MKASSHTHRENVFDLFSGLPLSKKTARRIIRLSPELDGLEILYSNQSNPGKLFALKVLCWALCEDGQVFGMIPWLNQLVPCDEIQTPLQGQWEGYFDPLNDDVFFEVPTHKVIEMEAAAEYYGFTETSDSALLQIIPDIIGTHAVFSRNENHQLYLTQVVSWHLRNNGEIHAMVIDQQCNFDTPVLPDAECLMSVMKNPEFRYFFQHHIANKIKAQDPEALAAMAILLGETDEADPHH